MAKQKKENGEIKFSDKDDMKPHSEAKVALYGEYLKKYLAILSNAKFTSKLNIYDVFCGTGIYKNGKFGSPVRAFKAIQESRNFLIKNNLKVTPISLNINDGNPKSVDKVSLYLTQLNKEDRCCDLQITNLDASDAFKNIIAQLSSKSSRERSLIFIDPTGYKVIHRENLLTLLKLNTEVVLFLPVSFMYRFKEVVQKDYNKAAYVHLRRFLYEFFDESHPIRQEKEMDVFEFINHLEEALRFENTFYTTSFFLQRNTNNYYALFFITSNILGLQRIIDAKWEIDPEQGRGFVYEADAIPSQLPLFPEIKPPFFKLRMEELERKITLYISNNQNCTNCDLYQFVLTEGFRTPHANQVIKKLRQEPKIQVIDLETNKEVRGHGTYLDYDHFKNKHQRVAFKML
ncbi:hypothetical protein GCM10023189_36780 [Nibrella saemangeumensis]|uniref:Three-Cys-motif partner protein n=1 Tax=Nibrella saemangeumensis TaxID=1084526 RepID=A0ABP8N8A4_9BACT